MSSLCSYADEPLEITYSYWDGAGHRRVLQVFLAFKILLLYFPALLALILSQISLRLEWIWCPDLSSISLRLCVSVGSQVRKGDSIAEFLRAVQHQLAAEFREIRTASVENLLYVKEDLIIPHVSVNSSIFLLSFHSQLARP